MQLFIHCLFSNWLKNDAQEWKSKDFNKLPNLKFILKAVFGKGDLFGHLKSVLDFLVPESLRFAESIALQTASIIYLFIYVNTRCK